MKQTFSSQLIFCACCILAQSLLVSSPGRSDPLVNPTSQKLVFSRGAKETVLIEGSALKLQATIWRNFMPVITDANSTRLGGTVSFIDVNGKPVPSTLHAVTVWVVQGDRVWKTHKVEDEEIDDVNPSIRSFKFGDGPKWPAQSYIDIFVRAVDQHDVHHLLVLRHQIIGTAV